MLTGNRLNAVEAGVAPATGNARLSALRGVIEAAGRIGQLGSGSRGIGGSPEPLAESAAGPSASTRSAS